MVEAAFAFYKQPAKLSARDGTSLQNCDAFVWDAELGLGRSVEVPKQNDGRTEISSSHFGVLSTMPLPAHERLQAMLDGKLQKFRIVGDVVIATPLYILKLNKEVQP